MPNYVNVKTGHWYLMHEVRCTEPAVLAWFSLRPPIGAVIGQATRPGLFRLWSVVGAETSIDDMLRGIAASTHASLKITTWFVHTDAPYAGMQESCGGVYIVADHVTDQTPDYFMEIQRRCCMHCSVELGLATRDEYERCRQHNAALVDGANVQHPAPEAPTEYSKLGMTKPQVLLCTVLDLKLKALLDDPLANPAEARQVAMEITKLVQEIARSAPAHYTSEQRFLVIQTLFPNAKLRLIRVEGTKGEIDTSAPIPESPEDGTQSFGM